MSFHFKDNKSAKAFADWLEKSDHQEVRAFVNIQDVYVKGNKAWLYIPSFSSYCKAICRRLENDGMYNHAFHHSPATVKQYAEGCVKESVELFL